MFPIFTFIFLLIAASADLNTVWQDAGCRPEGLLSPTSVPHFWRTVVDQTSFVRQLQNGVIEGDGMAWLSCRGQAPNSFLDTYSNTFHLIWECPKTSNCKLPPVHALCVRTLRKLHPGAEIKLWSTSLDESVVSKQLQDLDISVTQYDMTFFEELPVAAQNAAVNIRSYMDSDIKDRAHENAFSHWSDLFRAAVLYKEGGIYTDLDSIWLRPVTQASEATSWIPRTPAHQFEDKNDAVSQNGNNYFLEGGIMRFDDAHSPYLWQVLENFPEYNDEMATCWACVGPRLLTRTFNSVSDASSLPSLVDSEQLFGVRHYRNYFPNMFKEFDPMVWQELSEPSVVAAHLFTASPQAGISSESTIFRLLQVGGVNQATEVSASWRKQTEERRNLLSSLYYVDDGSALSSSASIGSGSVLYWYGEYETVTATVETVDFFNTNAYLTEVKDIFYSCFGVPLSAVSVTSVGPTTLNVVVSEVKTVNADADCAAGAIADSEVLPEGSSITTIDVPEMGYTSSTYAVTETVNTEQEYLDATLALYLGSQNAFGQDATVATTYQYYTYGNVLCNVGTSTTQEEIDAAYEAAFAELFDTTCVFYNADGTFYLINDDWYRAFEDYEYINNNNLANVPDLSSQCTWSTNRIDLHASTVVSESGVTYTDMETMSDNVQATLEGDGFTFLGYSIATSGQQEIGACEMLAECQADYEELYNSVVGDDLGLVTEEDSSAISWWWNYQIGRYLHDDYDINNLRVSNDGLFVYKYGDNYVNTCVQHSFQWASSCDDSVGVCAGSVNYGFSSQQASALNEALATTSLRHPECPTGCQFLSDEDQELISDATGIEDIESLCVKDGKYHFFENPITITDTCVGYSETSDDACPLSDYIFCSDVNYETGMVIYGNTTWQGYALEQALEQTDNRHPQCL